MGGRTFLSRTPDFNSGDCETGQAVAAGTCGAVAAVVGAASIFLCAVTLGVGCGVVAAAGAVAGVCQAVAENIQCVAESAGMDPGKYTLIERKND